MNSENVIFGVIISLALFFSTFAYFKERHVCEKTGEIMQTESMYEAFTGCFVKENNRFIPVKSFRAYREE
jgi:hypothetical protein